MQISVNNVKKILNAGLKTGADFAELYFQNKISTRIVLDQKQVNDVFKAQVCGVGIRLIKDNTQVYGYSASLNPKDILTVTERLAANFSGEQHIFVEKFENVKVDIVKPEIPHDTVSIEDKINYLKRGEKAIYDYSNEIINAQCMTSESDEDIEIYNSRGKHIKDSRTRSRVMFFAIASNGKTVQSASEGDGQRAGCEIYNRINPEECGKKAAKLAVELCYAEVCPSGEMPVILGNGFGGVLFHEACGHPLEAGAISKSLSVFTGKIGTKIASDVVNAFDDGTILTGYGSIDVDDEGNKATCNQLIKDGVLVNFMCDDNNSNIMNKDKEKFNNKEYTSTGACRRQSFRFEPTTRMTNTYIGNGESTVEEIIKNTKKGLYCVSFTGGQVDPSTCKFNFSVSEAYIVENGEIKQLVRGAGLIGYGYEILPLIDMVGNDLLISSGTCGASSGQIEVTVGQPTLRISKMTVAGAE